MPHVYSSVVSILCKLEILIIVFDEHNSTTGLKPRSSRQHPTTQSLEMVEMTEPRDPTTHMTKAVVRWIPVDPMKKFEPALIKGGLLSFMET